MILYKLGAFPNDLLLLKFQYFHLCHLSSSVTPFYYSAIIQSSGTNYRIPTTLSRISPPASTPMGEIATSDN
jgi:hypothetical protein